MMTRLDDHLVRFINGTLANPVCDVLMPVMSWLGSGGAVFAVAVLIIILSRQEKKMRGVLLLAGLTAVYYSTDLLKDLFARPRPFVAIPGLRVLESAGRNFSMPSGHAATAFMAATLLSRFFGRYAAWFAYAGLVAFSRVYLGVHYVSDVAVGALVGVMIGLILAWIGRTSHIS